MAFHNLKTTIQHYQPLLHQALEARGWQIEATETSNTLPLAADAWMLTSLWSPVGVQVFLVFEEDGYLAWAAAIREPLHEHASALHHPRLYLKRGIERDLSRFLADLDALRTSIAAR